MNRRIHGAPAQALSDALAALSGLAFWVACTADADLPPESRTSAREMRDAANALSKAARHLDEAADRAQPQSGPAGAGHLDPAERDAVPPPRPREVEPGSVAGGRGPAGEIRTPSARSPIHGERP